MLVLGIETSCDETAAAVVSDGRGILSSVVASQIVHAEYGGVVPELASRAHMQMIVPVVEEALEGADKRYDDLEGIAVTSRPGLIGSLLVGVSFAKGLAYALGIPVVGVDHIEGHIFATRLSHPDARLPAMCLTVSGGHTALVRVDEWGAHETVGRTRDDAAGEALDKVGKLLGLGYPAGATIERLAAGGNPTAIAFPRAMLDSGDLDFSFSGVKTAARYRIDDLGRAPVGKELLDFLASFQEAIVDILVTKTIEAAERCSVVTISIGGGVAANELLRGRLGEEAARYGFEIAFPEKELCTDNAVMIAAVGDFMLSKDMDDGLSLDASARAG